MPQKIAHKTVGSLWTPQFTFTVAGTPTDPTNLTVRTQDAAGIETVLLNNVLVSTLTGSSTPVKKVSTGVFQLNPGVTLTSSGYWYAKAEGAGAVVATIQDEAIVDPDEFTSNAGLSDRALVGLGEMKDWLRQQNLDVTSDLQLVSVINSVSNLLHQEAQREFKPLATNPQTRTFPIVKLPRSEPYYIDGEFIGYAAPGNRTVEFGPNCDLSSATTVQILGRDWTTVISTVAGTDYALHPLFRQPWEPFTSIEFKQTVPALAEGYRVTIAGTWGFPLVPEDIKQAAKDAVGAMFDRDVTNWRQDLSPAPTAPESGTVIMLNQGAQRILSLPPSSLAVAWSYRDPNLG